MQFLRYNTATAVRIGPAMAVADALTPVTNVNLVSADQAEALDHDGTQIDISGRTFTAITNCDGWYNLSLLTTDVDELGMLSIVIQDTSLILPIFKDFMVIPANAYDSLIAGSANLSVNMSEIGGSTTAMIDLSDLATDGYDSANNRVFSDTIAINGSVSAATNMEASAEVMIIGTVTGTPTPSDIVFGTGLSATYTTDDALIGRAILFRSDTTTVALRGQARSISSYGNTNGDITVNAPLTVAPAVGDTFVIA